RRVQFVGVNSNASDTLDGVAKHARDYGFTFPLLKDGTQSLANALHAAVTPEAFVLDTRLTVRYQGRIDDQYASRTLRKGRVASRDLVNALDAVLAGRPVSVPRTRALG